MAQYVINVDVELIFFLMSHNTVKERESFLVESGVQFNTSFMQAVS